MITLVLGGVRSGKSEVAEKLAGPGPVTYVATARVGDDADFAARVSRHRARRPASWATIEEPCALPPLLARLDGTVLVDALGTWVANDLCADIDALVEALRSRGGDTVVVSEEVGLGVHPVTELGRRFADVLGEANRRVSEVADRCLLVVAGRVVELPPGGPGVRSDMPGGPGVSAGTSPRPPVGSDMPRGPSVSAETSRRPGASPDVSEQPPPPTRSAPPETVAHPLRAAVAFLTPVGGAAQPTGRALAWFSVVGAALGLALGGWWWLTGELAGPLVGAAAVVAADLALTGALHFDGLVDSADGLLPHLDRERRLAVMAEPGVGAFGLAAGASALLLRTAALASFDDPRPLLLASLWAASRALMSVAACVTPYARKQGLASAFLSGRPSIGALTGVGAFLALGLGLADDLLTPVAVAAALVAAGGVTQLARRRIGGFTGDTLGAAGVAAETAGLLVAVAVS